MKPDPEFYELIIVGSSIIDGDLTPLFSADLGIKNGKIQAVGDLSGKKAARTIECSGCFLAPGFIDIHSHSDFSLLINPRAESKVRQGVTTEVIGNCGSSAAPLLGHKLKRVRERVEELDVNWKTLKEYRSRLEGAGVAVNVVPLTGQGNIRAAVIGYAERKPDRKEMVKMIALLEQSLEEGSGGISTGLVYPPGVYSDFVELLELIFPVARSGGIYATHMRNESDRVDEAVAEAIALAEKSGVSLQISHLKAQGKANWRLMDQCFREIEGAREEGLDVHCDRYPYTASSTDLDILLPEWVYQGGTAEELNRLADPGLREKIKKGVTWEDWEAVVISLVSTEANKVFEGRRLTEITAEKNLSPPDCLIELLREEGAKVEALFFSLSPENLERVLGRPYCMVGSDGSAKADYGPLSRGKPHPRSFGTFPRFLHRSAGRGALSWEKAVHRITGLPAEKLGLSDRGAIKEGAAADLVVFDPERIVDRATYENPHRYPEGIEYVIVNGEVVIGKGEHTGRLPGRFLVK